MKMPPRLGQWAVAHQAGDDVPGTGHRAGTHLDAMLGVEADDDTGATVDLAVDPDFAVVVDVGLEPHARAGQRDAADGCGHLDLDAVPGEGEADRAALADIGADRPV